MNDPNVRKDLDNGAGKPLYSSLSGLSSRNHFDLASISENRSLATDNDDDDDDQTPDLPARKRTKGCLSVIAVPTSIKAPISKASGGNAGCAATPSPKSRKSSPISMSNMIVLCSTSHDLPHTLTRPCAA